LVRGAQLGGSAEDEGWVTGRRGDDRKGLEVFPVRAHERADAGDLRERCAGGQDELENDRE
jgi:hypothetical protein